MLHLSMNGISTRRRILLLLVGCSLPLFFIGLTTSWLHPEYLQPFDLSRFRPSSDSSPNNLPPELAHETPVRLSPSEPVATAPPAAKPTERWSFDTERDERNFGLTDEQCLVAFPDFYREIDRAVSSREAFGPITRGDLDISWREGNEMLRAMIYDRQIYIIEARWADHGFDIPRALAILSSINRAIVSCPTCHIPNIEFSFCLGDVASLDFEEEGKRAIWSLTRREWEDEKWLMPDFGYWSWPLNVVGEYTQVRTEIRALEEDLKFEDKKPLVVWRGSTKTNILREYLVNGTIGKSWSDIQAIEWRNMTTMMPGDEELSISMPDHCAYQFVVHTEGHSYSGRGKYLQNCLSVFIMHKIEWIEPHTHLLVATGERQNMVQVERDFSDLEEKVQRLLAQPAEARAIAEEGARVFRDRYLTPAAQACYWRRLFVAWKSVMAFEPELWLEDEQPDIAPPPPSSSLPPAGAARLARSAGFKARTMRGTPFESFILQQHKPSPPKPSSTLL